MFLEMIKQKDMIPESKLELYKIEKMLGEGSYG